MTIQPALPLRFDFFEPLPIVIETSYAPLTSDAGLLPLRQFDDRIGLTREFAATLHDPRDPDRTEHSFLEMVRMRLFGILADYEDQNDHDTLRTDPVFKLIADRSPEADDLASQPTLSRFENAIDCPSLKRLRDVFIDQFIASFATPPLRLTMDRLSDHRFKANYFRLYLHATALNLLVRLRREIADPLPMPAASVPVEALAGAERQRYQRLRRQRDPLGEGQPWTWRTLVLKVAASVVVSSRRVLVLLSGGWPHLAYYRRVRDYIARRPAVAHTWSG